MKLNFSLLLVFICFHVFGQGELLPSFTDAADLSFHSVADSKSEMTEEAFRKFKIAVPINEQDAFLIKKKTVLLIAIKNQDKYDVYELLKWNENRLNIKLKDTLFQDFEADTISLKEQVQAFADPRNACTSTVRIIEIENRNLDGLQNKELIIKFSYDRYCCQTCSVPINTQSSEGCIIFDFDTLQTFAFTSKSNMNYTSKGIPVEVKEIKFEKNYLKVGKRKYYYKENKWVRK